MCAVSDEMFVGEVGHNMNINSHTNAYIYVRAHTAKRYLMTYIAYSVQLNLIVHVHVQRYILSLCLQD